MFTGIIQTRAAVQTIVDKDQFRTLTLAVPNMYLQQLQQGASIAINGTCLTVTAFALAEAPEQLGWVRFDIIDETLKLTNLGQLQVGSEVNFERSLTVGSELGGHILSGHIQTQATVLQIQQTEFNWSMELALPEPWQAYLFSKGFIAIDGISLTVGAVDAGRFWLHIIPETLAITTLGQRQVGDTLNIEIDQQTMTIVQTVTRTVERMLSERGLLTQ